jgi:hypothetical protein
LCHPNYKFPEGWNVTHSENHWSNEQTMQEYAENVLILYVESVVDEYPLNRKDQKALCLFDVVAAHKTDSFKDKLDDNDIKIRFVPASCTGELVTGNDEFKRKIKNSFINWHSDELSKGMKLGKAASNVKIDIKLSTIKPIHASWIVVAFQQVTKETLIRGWEKMVSSWFAHF